MTTEVTITAVTGVEARSLKPALADILIDCADVAKMLVHGDARKQGIGAALMLAAEAAARGAGKTLLVLDAVTGGDGERLYERLDWSRVGVIPGFALFPDGRPCDTTFFYKVVGGGS